MRRVIYTIVILAVFFAILSCSRKKAASPVAARVFIPQVDFRMYSPTPTPTISPTSTVTQTTTPKGTFTVTPTITLTSTVTETIDPNFTKTATPTVSPTATPALGGIDNFEDGDTINDQLNPWQHVNGWNCSGSGAKSALYCSGWISNVASAQTGTRGLYWGGTLLISPYYMYSTYWASYTGQVDLRCDILVDPAGWTGFSWYIKGTLPLVSTPGTSEYRLYLKGASSTDYYVDVSSDVTASWALRQYAFGSFAPAGLSGESSITQLRLSFYKTRWSWPGPILSESFAINIDEVKFY